MNLRDYMYLDVDRLQNYISSLDSGTVEELTEFQRQQTGGQGEGGLDVPGVTLKGGGAHERETTQQRNMRVTEQNMFDRIYDALDDDKDIKGYDEDSHLPFEEVKRREIVEVTRTFKPSPMNELIDKVFGLMDTMRGFGFVEEVNDPETQEAVQGLAMLFRGEEGREEVPMVARSEGGDDDSSVVFVAKSRFLTVDQSDFQGELTLFGRVNKLIPSGDSLDLFDFLKIPRELSRDANMKKEILSMFETWPKELGGPVSKESLRVPGPVVIVTPVAVYEA